MGSPVASAGCRLPEAISPIEREIDFRTPLRNEVGDDATGHPGESQTGMAMAEGKDRIAMPRRAPDHGKAVRS